MAIPETKYETYYDKKGNRIKPGDIIQHDDGEREYVYLGEEGELGINASNENFVGFDETKREIYPLFQFNMSEWTIVEK